MERAPSPYPRLSGEGVSENARVCEDTGVGLCQPDGVPPRPLNPHRSPPITRINPPTSENIPPANDVPFLPGSRKRILARRAYGRFSLTSLPLCLPCGLILKQSCTTPPVMGWPDFTGRIPSVLPSGLGIRWPPWIERLPPSTFPTGVSPPPSGDAAGLGLPGKPQQMSRTSLKPHDGDQTPFDPQCPE